MNGKKTMDQVDVIVMFAIAIILFYVGLSIVDFVRIITHCNSFCGSDGYEWSGKLSNEGVCVCQIKGGEDVNYNGEGF